MLVTVKLVLDHMSLSCPTETELEKYACTELEKYACVYMYHSVATIHSVVAIIPKSIHKLAGQSHC